MVDFGSELIVLEDFVNLLKNIIFAIPFGGVAEWSMAAVLKTVERVSVPGVRIPPPPRFRVSVLSCT